MTIARWQNTIVDDKGNVQGAASIEVRREQSGAPLATIYSDREGTTPLGNPMTAGSDGFAAFHVAGGAYRITATKGGFSRVWRYVGIGLASEQDSAPVGISYIYDPTTADADPGAGFFRLNDADPGSATAIYLDDVDADGLTETSWLDTLDDGGSSSDRGTLVLRSSTAGALLVATITGSVVDGSGYRKLTISVLAASAANAFTAGARFSMIFNRAGIDGIDGEVTSTGSFAAGDLARFTDTGGDEIESSGKSITTIGAGKQTAWIPASAMKKRTTGPADGSFSAGSTEFDYLAFDPTTEEDATFSVAMPKGWNESSGISFQVYWLHPATTTNFGVVWSLLAKAYGSGDAIDGASYTGIAAVTDTGGVTSRLEITLGEALTYFP